MPSIVDHFLFPFNGLRVIFRPGYRKFVWAPLTVNMLLLSLFAWLAIQGYESVLNQYLPDGSWWDLLRPVAWLLFVTAYALGAFFGFTLLANLIGAPFNGLLAERIEAGLVGHPPPGSGQSLAADTPRMLRDELLKGLYFVIRAVPILVLFLIPGLNLIAPLLWVLLGCWWLAFEYLDYPLGNHGLSLREQRALMRGHRLACLAFGAGASLLLLIPVVNLAAMPATVAGATRLALSLRGERPA